jgi:hypothetical protein
MVELIGTIPQWITAGGLITIIGYVLLHRRGMRKLAIEAQQVNINADAIAGQERKDIRDHYAQEVNRYAMQVVGLREELEACETKCERRIDALEAEHERRIAKLERRNKELLREVWGEKTQRVAEQISLINVILRTVDAPELKTLMKTLESIQRQQIAPPEDNGNGDNGKEKES